MGARRKRERRLRYKKHVYIDERTIGNGLTFADMDRAAKCDDDQKRMVKVKAQQQTCIHKVAT